MKKTMMALMFAVALPALAASPDVYFSPNGGAEAAVVSQIDGAQKDLHIMTYQLTNKNITEAVLQAFGRGVHVSIIVDRSQRNPTKGDQYCCAAKVAKIINTKLDAKHPIHHNKVIVIDGETVITGSFNFSNAAEHSNAENMLVIHDPELAKKYLATWEVHAAHSEQY